MQILEGLHSPWTHVNSHDAIFTVYLKIKAFPTVYAPEQKAETSRRSQYFHVHARVDNQSSLSVSGISCLCGICIYDEQPYDSTGYAYNDRSR